MKYQLLIFAGSFLAEYRTYDGSNNNIDNPLYGAANTPYVRIQAPAHYEDGVSTVANRGRPSPLAISNQVFPAPNRLLQNNEGFSDYLAYWGQFLAHDILLTPDDTNPNSTFTMDAPACALDGTCDGIKQNITMQRAGTLGIIDGVRSIQNRQTAYVDASHIYGFTNDRAKALRQPNSPYLKTNFGGKLMPTIEDGFEMAGSNPRRFMAGDVRGNENPALQSLQTLFVREHNRKCDEILAKYPYLEDEIVFQEARKWVMAVNQKISYDEYLALILGEKLPPYTGYDATINPGIDSVFFAASFRYGHSAINPLILRVDPSGNQIPEGHLLLRDVFFNPMPVLQSGIEPILRGLCLQVDSMVDTIIIDDLRKFFIAQPFDLVAVNTMRGRDVGLPTYNEARQSMGLPRVTKWSDITADEEVQNNLYLAYGHVDQIDIYVGGLAEDHVNNSILGPLFHSSIKEQFLRLRDGDRFWYQGSELGLSKDDLAAVEQMTMSKLVTLNTDIPKMPGSVFVVPNPTVFSFSGAVSSGSSSSSSSSVISELQLMDGLHLAWVKTSTQITFTYSSNHTGWFGVGFATSMSMVNADLIICSTESTGFTCSDYFASSFNPTKDTDLGGTNDVVNVLDVTSKYPWHKKVMQFTRLLTTPDSKYDFAMTGDTLPMLFAFSDTPTLQYHGPNNRAKTTVSFSAAAGSNSPSDLTLSSNLAELKRVYYLIHGGIMIVCFGILAPYAIYVARKSSYFPKWLSAHQNRLSFIVHLAVTDVLISSITSIIDGSNYFTITHVKIGMTVISLCIILIIMGYYSLSYEGINNQTRLFIRNIHFYGGYAAFVLGLTNCSLGLRDVYADIDPNFTASWCFIAYAVLLLSFIFYLEKFIVPFLKSPLQRIRSWSSSKGSFNEEKSVPTFTWNEVHSRVDKNAQWIIIRNKIYDVKELKQTHPGGKEVLNQVIGIDATQVFEGKKSVQYFMDTTEKETGKQIKIFIEKRYSHSRIAEFDLSGFIVGQLPISVDNLISDEIDNPDVFFPVVLSEKKSVVGFRPQSQVYKFTFKFQSPDLWMGNLPGDAVLLRLIIAGKPICRLFTPIRTESHSQIDLVIKIYQDGIFTSYLNKLPIGSEIFMRGPLNLEPEVWNEADTNGVWPKMGLLTAGTGMTPAFLMIEHHLKHGPVDEGKQQMEIVWIIVCHSQDDLIDKERIDELVKRSRGCLSVYYVFHQLRHQNPVGVQIGFDRPSFEKVFVNFHPQSKKMFKKSSEASLQVRNRRTLLKKSVDLIHSIQKPINTSRRLSVHDDSMSGHYSAIPNNSGSRRQSAHISDNAESKDIVVVNHEDFKFIICGPSNFNDTATAILVEIGYDPLSIARLGSQQLHYNE